MTTQEELPPLPECDTTPFYFSRHQMYEYASQCIATLKAENERMRAEVEQIGLERLHPAQAEMMIQEYKDKAAAMAGLLEEAEEAIAEHHFPKAAGSCINCDVLARIESALAAWKGEGK